VIYAALYLALLYKSSRRLWVYVCESEPADAAETLITSIMYYLICASCMSVRCELEREREKENVTC